MRIKNMFPPLLSKANRNSIDRVGDAQNHKSNESDDSSLTFATRVSASGKPSATSGSRRTVPPKLFLPGPSFLSRKLHKSYSGRSSSFASGSIFTGCILALFLEGLATANYRRLSMSCFMRVVFHPFKRFTLRICFTTVSRAPAATIQWKQSPARTSPDGSPYDDRRSGTGQHAR